MTPSVAKIFITCRTVTRTDSELCRQLRLRWQAVAGLKQAKSPSYDLSNLQVFRKGMVSEITHKGFAEMMIVVLIRC
ncbi:hypothetical protein ACVW0I_000137 [Bradyrhizobium sp. LM6.11]